MDKSGLFSIGQMAKIFHISQSSIRYYEKSGFLTPEYVAPDSGYRYYSARQFEVFNTIRYLRAHADELLIDPARVCVWGTSSGGNTALLVGVTANDARYETEEYAGVDDGAQLIVDFFGPANLPKMAGLVRESQSNESLLGALADRTVVVAQDGRYTPRELTGMLRAFAGRVRCLEGVVFCRVPLKSFSRTERRALRS